MSVKGSAFALSAILSLSLCIPLATNSIAATPPAARTLTAPSDIREELSQYNDRGAGITFAYPKGFRSTPEASKESLVKLSGVTSAGANGEIQLSAVPEDFNVETLGHMVSESFQKQVPGYQPGTLEWVRFGRGYKMNGVTRVASFKIGDTRFCQRVIHWSQNSKIYTLAMLGPESQWSTLDPLYNYILLSVAPGASTGSASSRTNSAGASSSATTQAPISYASWFKKGIGGFSYPADWHIQENPDPDVIVKMSGTDGSGKGGEMQLAHYASWDAISLQQFADTVESTYLKPQKKYARISEGTVTFGAGTRLEAIRRTATMLVNGVDAVSHTAFWTAHGKHYCLAIFTVGYSRADSEKIFGKALQTLSIEGSQNTAEHD